MPEAFVTWIDTGERRAIAAAPRVSALLQIVASENQADEINIEELTKMANQTSKRLREIREKQDGHLKAVASLNPKNACKLNNFSYSDSSCLLTSVYRCSLASTFLVWVQSFVIASINASRLVNFNSSLR